MSLSIEFEHPTNGGRVTLITSQIFGVMDMPQNKIVAVIGPGSALVPVAGTHEEVLKRVLDAKKEEQKKDEENGKQ